MGPVHSSFNCVQESEREDSYRNISTQSNFYRKQNISIQTNFSRKQSISIQTDIEQHDVSTQTITRFTEKLTDFNSKALGSESCFDQICDICHQGEKEVEAVGNCGICNQYMCISCCRLHERISLTSSHVVRGRDEFNAVVKERELFDRYVVPFRSEYVTDRKIPCTVKYNNHILEVTGLAYFDEEDTPAISLIYSRIDGCGCKSRESLKKGTLKNKTVISSLHGRYIWDMCFSNQHKTIYTKNTNEKKVYQLTPESELSPSFNTQGKCYGIATFAGGLALSINLTTAHKLPEWQVQYLTYTGDLKRQIYRDRDGSPIFKKPLFLASNTQQDMLFVSDNSQNAVISLNIEGEVLFKYQHETLVSPKGLSVDDENNVYVACNDKVIQIQADHNEYRTLLCNKRVMDYRYLTANKFQNVCFSTWNKTLSVADGSGNITVFKFLP